MLIDTCLLDMLLLIAGVSDVDGSYLCKVPCLYWIDNLTWDTIDTK